MKRRIIIDCYTEFANTLYHAEKKMKWAEDVGVAPYHACPQYSQVVAITTKTEEEVEEWLMKRTFKGFINTWIGVVEDERWTAE